MNKRGMTLLEVMLAVALFTMVMGTLFMLSQSLGEAVRREDARVTALDASRVGRQAVVSELRQAARMSINWNELPGPSISYRIAVDSDGNGSAVDVQGNLELSGSRIICADTADANGDGIGATQLVLIDGDNVRVLANNLALNEDRNGNGDLDAGEDRNGNGRLERGVWFEPQGNRIILTIQTQHRPGPREAPRVSTVTEILSPRN